MNDMTLISTFSPWLLYGLLIGTGILSGFVDSIAGGGGLINLPMLILILGPGAVAIGTNKIAGTFAAFVALLVYARKGHMDWKKSILFTIAIGVGAGGGSLIAPLLPFSFFRWFLVLSCPLILWVVFSKDMWVTQENRKHSRSPQVYIPQIIASGLLCGLYDGVWGPGGGTFMFLALLFIVRLPLLTAIAASKLANTCSAGVALMSYTLQGYVHWTEGLFLAVGVSLGAWFGAHYATRSASKIVRPILAVVVGLLVLKLLL